MRSSTAPPLPSVRQLPDHPKQRLDGTSLLPHRCPDERCREKTMIRLLAKTGLAVLAVAALSSAAAASEWTSLDGVVQQRIDTEEVLLPPPPRGPATPVPFCSPGSPICP